MSLEQKILAAVREVSYKPVKAIPLARWLQVPKSELPEFREAIANLLKTGRIREGRNGLLRPATMEGLIAGIVKRTAGGFGFLIPEQKRPDGDIYISASDMIDAQSGDEVLVKLLPQSRGGDQRVRGKIVEIVQRARYTFVGRYFESAGQGFVQPDGTTLNDPVYVGDPGAKGALPDDKVVFEMLRFPQMHQPGEGVLTEVLGPRGQPGVDTLSIIRELGIPDVFPEEVLEEARIQADQFDENDLGDRLDLTGELIVTIDPIDARDFDDAISLERIENGHWKLGVHIADVSHFVPSGSALDREAHLRGTSVYLPDRVIPMLPEIISNALASLQQGKVRYTKSAFIEFDPTGVPIQTEFANTVIKVAQRFAYEQVLPIIENTSEQDVAAPIRELLERMHTLAMMLRNRRFKQGALELTMPEIKIDLDAEGKVSGAHLTPHDASHQIIEEFMLAANIAVATELDDRHVAFLRRVHADPDEPKLRALAEFVNSLGFHLKKYQSRRELQKLLAEAHEKPTMHAVNYALLRSLKQAEYSSDELGHFALSVDNYCHFTSPIRRYPDLTIHRLLDRIFAKGKSPSSKKTTELVALGKHCSRTERRAEEAERELIKVKLLTYMSTRVGEEFDAIITGVQDFGFFCQGVEIPAEGLVHVSSLGDDYYYYEQATHSLVGRRGKQFRLGDQVRVAVNRVDIDRRQLDYRLVDMLVPAPNSAPRSPSRPSKGPARQGKPPKKSDKGNKKGKAKAKKKGKKRKG